MFSVMLQKLIEDANKKIEDFLFCEQDINWANEVIEYCEQTNGMIKDLLNTFAGNDEESYSLAKSAHECRDKLFRLKDKAQLFIHKFNDEKARRERAEKNIEYLKQKAMYMEKMQNEQNLRELERKAYEEEQRERELENRVRYYSEVVETVFNRLYENKTFSTKEVISLIKEIETLPYDYQNDVKNIAALYSVVELAKKIDDISSSVVNGTQQDKSESIDSIDYTQKVNEYNCRIEKILTDHEEAKQINTAEIKALGEEISTLPNEYKTSITNLDKFYKLLEMVTLISKLNF